MIIAPQRTVQKMAKNKNPVFPILTFCEDDVIPVCVCCVDPLLLALYAAIQNIAAPIPVIHGNSHDPCAHTLSLGLS